VANLKEARSEKEEKRILFFFHSEGLSFAVRSHHTTYGVFMAQKAIRNHGRFFGWIEKQGGARGAAKRTGISWVAFKQWLRGGASPTSRNMVRLVKMSGGAFDYNDIVVETFRPDVRKKMRPAQLKRYRAVKRVIRIGQKALSQSTHT
jgi:hypothetical protein